MTLEELCKQVNPTYVKHVVVFMRERREQMFEYKYEDGKLVSTDHLDVDSSVTSSEVQMIQSGVDEHNNVIIVTQELV